MGSLRAHTGAIGCIVLSVIVPKLNSCQVLSYLSSITDSELVNDQYTESYGQPCGQTY